MAPIFIDTTTTAPSTQLETPVIIIICVFAYLIIFLIAIFIRQCILSAGFCTDCNVCGKADNTNNCCDCCIEFAQACDCRVPGTNTCCESICGPRQHRDIADCLTCGLCGGETPGWCEEPTCPGFFSCSCCTCPAVKCEKPECNEIHCLCFTISCGDTQSTATAEPPLPQYPYSYPSPARHSINYPYSSSRYPGSYRDPNRPPTDYLPQPSSSYGQHPSILTQPSLNKQPFNLPPGESFQPRSNRYPSTRYGYPASGRQSTIREYHTSENI